MRRVFGGKRRVLFGVVGGVAVAGLAGSVGAFRPRATSLAITARPGDDTLVVNQVDGSRLSVIVFDQYGRTLRTDTTARYARIGGDSIAIEANGRLDCERRRDDVAVRATLGKLSKEFVLRCRPVKWIETPSWVELMVGDSARDLAFTARDPDGRVVKELRGTLRVENSAIVDLAGTTLLAKRPGMTFVNIEVGNAKAGIPVGVYEPVTSFVQTPQEPMMGMRVALTRGDTITVPVPKAVFWVTYYAKDPALPPPTIELRGDGFCTTGNGIRVRRVEDGTYAKYCTAGNGVQMLIAHGAAGADTVRGFIAVRLMWR